MNDIERGDDVEALCTESLLFRWFRDIVSARGDVGVCAGTCSGVGKSDRNVAHNVLADEVVVSAQNLREIPRQRAGTFGTTSDGVGKGKPRCSSPAPISSTFKARFPR